jgi:GT2 family glycosyltransferase
MPSLTSAVVVNYNGGDFNFTCIDSLLRDPHIEVIVVDNASVDGSPDAIARRYGDRVALVRMTENTGFARGCNAGAAIASGPFLLFFNNDAVANPGMADTLRGALEDDPEIGVVGPVVLDARDPDVIQYTGPTIDRWGFTYDSTTGARADSLPPQRVRECFYISGCALMIRASLFHELGGFDAGMFMFCEDVDLCWRARLAGLRVATIRDASCFHTGGGTAPIGKIGGVYRTSDFRIREREKNTLRLMAVNLGTANLLKYVTFYYPFWIAEAVAGLALGRYWVVKAYLAAFWCAMVQLPDTLRRRRTVQRSRRTPDKSILALWSPRYEKLRFIRRVGLPSPP